MTTSGRAAEVLRPDVVTSARTVLTACRLMYLGALLEAAGVRPVLPARARPAVTA